MKKDIDTRRHDERIGALLDRKAAERINSRVAHEAVERGYDPGSSVTNYTPLDALLLSESEDGEEAAARSEIIGRFLDYVMQNGLHPASVMKNVYAAVHALRPKAIPGSWTCQDFADLFGETKAAHSWRVKQLFGKRLAKNARRPIKALFQKASGSTANYSEAQKGNTNRRHGIPRAAA